MLDRSNFQNCLIDVDKKFRNEIFCYKITYLPFNQINLFFCTKLFIENMADKVTYFHTVNLPSFNKDKKNIIQNYVFTTSSIRNK